MASLTRRRGRDSCGCNRSRRRLTAARQLRSHRPQSSNDADSGEIWCAWRRTSTRPPPGILMSVTSRRTAHCRFCAWPLRHPVTVHLWPSRRRAMSSSFADRALVVADENVTPRVPPAAAQRGSGGCRCGGGGGCSASGALVMRMLHAPQRTTSSCPATAERAHTLPSCAGRSGTRWLDQPGSAFKVRLEGLEYLFRLLRVMPDQCPAKLISQSRPRSARATVSVSTFGRRLCLCLYCAHRFSQKFQNTV